MGALTPGQGAPSSDLRQVRRMVLPCPWACRIFAGACARSMLPAPNCTAIKVPHAVVLAGHGCTNSGARRPQQRPAAGKTGRLPWACRCSLVGRAGGLRGACPRIASVPRVNRPGRATAHKAARGIASVAAATAARSCDSPRPLPAPDR